MFFFNLSSKIFYDGFFDTMHSNAVRNLTMIMLVTFLIHMFKETNSKVVLLFVVISYNNINYSLIEKNISFCLLGKNCLQVLLDLSFQEAARGVNKEIALNVKDTCPKCRGSGAEPGSSPSKCTQCNGTGMVRTRWIECLCGSYGPYQCPSKL